MSTFAAAIAERRAPGATLVLEPWVFADEWSSKPKATVCIGLRLLSEGAKTKARQTAEELADSVHRTRDDNWVDCYNDCLMRQVVALGICDPNDVNQPFELMRYAEAQVSDALSTRGVVFLHEALDRHEIATSPIGDVAGPDDFSELSDLLLVVEPEALPLSLRRLAAHLLNELEQYAS